MPAQASEKKVNKSGGRENAAPFQSVLRTRVRFGVSVLSTQVVYRFPEEISKVLSVELGPTPESVERTPHLGMEVRTDQDGFGGSGFNFWQVNPLYSASP